MVRQNCCWPWRVFQGNGLSWAVCALPSTSLHWHLSYRSCSRLEKEFKARAIERARRIDEEFFPSKSRGKLSIASRVFARARRQVADTLERFTTPARSFLQRLSCKMVDLESSVWCTISSRHKHVPIYIWLCLSIPLGCLDAVPGSIAFTPIQNTTNYV